MEYSDPFCVTEENNSDRKLFKWNYYCEAILYYSIGKNEKLSFSNKSVVMNRLT